MNLIEEFQPDCSERQTFTSGESSAKEENEGNISTIRGLDIQAQGDIMNLIKSFDSNNLKDGTFTSGVSLQLST